MPINSINPSRLLCRALSWLTCCYCLLSFNQVTQAEPRLTSIDRQNAIVCPATLAANPPNFSEPECIATAFYDVDPQNTAIWIKTTIALPDTWLGNSRPLGLFVQGKTSSEAYFNGRLVGRSGTPSPLKADEFPGNIDSVFYLPSPIIQPNNEVVLKLSSHHGFLHLASPIHFVGVGDFVAPESLFQRYTFLSMMLLGALILTILYFLVLRYQSQQPREHTLFLLMSSIAAAQLAAESVRGFYSYSYPLHDLRLIVIVLLSMGFGLCLLALVAWRFSKQRFWHWLGIGGLTTSIAILAIPYFDAKTAFAILIPASCATALVAFETYRERTRELAGYLAAFLTFDIIVLVTLNTFHNITYYLIIAAMIAYLFITQARSLSRGEQRLAEEQQSVSKLVFRLDQLKQQEKPTKVVISSAGEVSQIATDNIRYCKASGDYAELHLNEGGSQLFSGPLKALEDKLPSTFLRVHRSYIVNLDYVATLKSLSGAGTLILRNGEEIPVSRRIIPTVRDTLKGA
ncbi:MAG: LytTR family DNA-binding domain-containing protein [Halioglobus sp.]